MKAIKCMKCKKVYFPIERQEVCPFCGARINSMDFPDIFKDMFGGFNNEDQ